MSIEMKVTSLDQARQLVGLTQDEVADAFREADPRGVARSRIYIRKIERKEISPTLLERGVLARLFGMDLADVEMLCLSEPPRKVTKEMRMRKRKRSA